jgi:hypothetical protein
MDNVTPLGFSVLDLVLTPRDVLKVSVAIDMRPWRHIISWSAHACLLHSARREQSRNSKGLIGLLSVAQACEIPFLAL